MPIACTVAPTHSAGLPTDIAAAVSRSCDADSDCAAIGIGARACGGPADYLVYSKRASDVPALACAVARYNAQRAEGLRESGAISTCEALTPPAVSCRAGTCVGDRNATMPLQ